MTETPSNSEMKTNRGSWLLFALVIALFGGLMAFRGEIQSVWLRASIAGAAFAILFVAIWRIRRKT